MRFQRNRVGEVALICVSLALGLCGLRSRAADQTTVAKARTPDPDDRSEAVRKALENKVSFTFNRRPLSNVLADIRKSQHINIEINERALADADITSEEPITIAVKEIPLAAALHKILDRYMLGCTILAMCCTSRPSAVIRNKSFAFTMCTIS